MLPPPEQPVEREAVVAPEPIEPEQIEPEQIEEATQRPAVATLVPAAAAEPDDEPLPPPIVIVPEISETAPEAGAPDAPAQDEAVPDTTAPAGTPVETAAVTPDAAVDEETATIAPVPVEASEPIPRWRLHDKGHSTEEMAPAKGFPVDAPSVVSLQDEPGGAVDSDTAAAEPDDEPLPPPIVILPEISATAPVGDAPDAPAQDEAVPDTTAPAGTPVETAAVTPDAAVDEETATIAPTPVEASEPIPRRRLDDTGHGTEEMAPAKEFPVDAPSVVSLQDEPGGAVDSDTAAAEPDDEPLPPPIVILPEISTTAPVGDAPDAPAQDEAVPDTTAPAGTPVETATVTPDAAADEETATSLPAPVEASEPIPRRRLDDTGHGTEEMAPAKEFSVDAPSVVSLQGEPGGAVDSDTASADDAPSSTDAAVWVEPTVPPPSDDDVETEILFATVDPSAEPATQDAVAAQETAETPETATSEATAALAPTSPEDDDGVEDGPKAEDDGTVGDESEADDDPATTAEPDAEREVADTAAPGGADEMRRPAVRTNLGGGEGDRTGNMSDAKYDIIDWDVGIIIDTDSTSDDIEVDK